MPVAIPKPIHKIDNKSSKLSRVSSNAATTTRCLQVRCSVQSKHNIEIGRRSGGYQPALWSFDSIQNLNSEYKEDKHQIRYVSLIGQVKMLLHEEVDDVRRLELIDDFHRLEVFDCFKNDEGTDFKTSIVHDIKGLLQLYEASFLLKQGEETLELAREFSTNILQKKLDNNEIDDDNLLSSIRGALEFPIHWKVQMPNARLFIDDCKRRPDMNPIVLELAKLEINMVQAQFQEELKETSRWWESTCLVQELPFIRDRIVECYLWTTGVIQQRQHGYERIMLTKINALVTTIDDVFDIYGTVEELQLFRTAIQRWDIESLSQLPTYMQLCYLALHNFVHEMAYDTLKEKGFNSIPYLRKTWVDLVEAYMIEANWYYNGHKPSLEDYINNAWISIGGVPILSHIFFRLTDSIEKKDVESLHKYHDVVRASCSILRLADDIGTSPDEVERGDVPKSIQCYMNENIASEEEAREHVRSVIAQTWKTVNEEMLSVDSPFSKHFIEAAANLARMAQFIYQDGSDGFGMQHSKKPVRAYVSNRAHSKGMFFYTCSDSLRGGCKFFRWVDECSSQDNSGEFDSSKVKMSTEDIAHDMKIMAECMMQMSEDMKKMAADVANIRKLGKAMVLVFLFYAVVVFFLK
ncbi:hypothetical protein C2S53_010555 [Perilla frutescens var. hirtella]|uniref:GRF-type domain-containing protein n=1 Tax=Perilla frutescens var. hirtella TaxID=608512 RepID=A0AAD4J3U3_PERFH|nr:hypothetical protein C2S53_010555 [Perilla frutescens var. hirtella]